MNALTLLTYSLVVATVMSAVGMCLEQVMVSVHRPRRWAWCFTLTLSVLLPLGAMVFPGTPVVPTIRAAALVPSQTLAELARTSGLPPLTIESSSNSVSNNPAALMQSGSMNRLGLALLAGSLLVVPAMLSVQWLQLRARRRRWQEAELDSSLVLVSEDFGPAVVGAEKFQLRKGERLSIAASDPGEVTVESELGEVKISSGGPAGSSG